MFFKKETFILTNFLEKKEGVVLPLRTYLGFKRLGLLYNIVKTCEGLFVTE